LLLDQLEAPEPVQFQWLLHAFERMDLKEQQIRSRRKGATLQVELRSPAGLTLSQTDQFDVPYNQGIPKSFHRQVANHWHATAETKRPARQTRIGAIMTVTGPQEKFESKRLEKAGWLGFQAQGKFGEVEGWIQLQPNSPGPNGFGARVQSGQARLCGRARDGEVFYV
jgi:hypothetical protein